MLDDIIALFDLKYPSILPLINKENIGVVTHVITSLMESYGNLLESAINHFSNTLIKCITTRY